MGHCGELPPSSMISMISMIGQYINITETLYSRLTLDLLGFELTFKDQTRLRLYQGGAFLPQLKISHLLQQSVESNIFLISPTSQVHRLTELGYSFCAAGAAQPKRYMYISTNRSGHSVLFSSQIESQPIPVASSPGYSVKEPNIY